jgi:hypothetical protein
MPGAGPWTQTQWLQVQAFNQHSLPMLRVEWMEGNPMLIASQWEEELEQVSSVPGAGEGMFFSYRNQRHPSILQMPGNCWEKDRAGHPKAALEQLQEQEITYSLKKEPTKPL